MYVGDRGELTIKSVKNKYVLSMRYKRNEYSIEMLNIFSKLFDMSRYMESQTGDMGLYSCIVSLKQAERDAFNRFKGIERSHGIDARTIINENGRVSARVFKEKIEFRFMDDVFEALVGFVRTHSTNEMVCIKMHAC